MSSASRISACIITLNEEENIQACIESLRWCDEIIVVDSFSSDRTVEIARSLIGNVAQRTFTTVSEQKNYAVSLASHAWVLNVDADERVPPELAEEIRSELAANAGSINGYFMPRRTYFLGRWISRGAWYPDRTLRLFRRDKGSFQGTHPHAKVHLDGSSKTLRRDLHHFTYRDLAHNLETINTYADHFAAQERAHPAWALVLMLLKPPVKFVETFIYKRGFLDGWPGFMIAAMNSFYVFLKYAKLWERSRRPSLRS